MTIRYLTLLVFLSVFVSNSSGQISYGGIPASFSYHKKAATEVPVIEMAPVDNGQLLKEERSNPDNLKSYFFAKNFDVDISPDNSGKWEVAGDTKIWRVGLRSKGAWSLNVIFDKMAIPNGASLFIYSKDHEKILGAFTNKNEQAPGYFSTYPVPGDEIVVEYNEPVNTLYPGELHISSLNHDYKNIFGTRPLGESGLCNMDVYCTGASSYVTDKQSVVDLIIDGRELCTGTLVNNVNQDKTPYILTAGHCIQNSSDASKTIFCFNYESPTCGGGASSVNGYADQTLSGAILKARSDSLDFALVELSTLPPVEYRPYFAGWSNSSEIPTSTVAIHHPKGDVKKVCKDYDPPKIGDFKSGFLHNSFMIIGKWDIGTTEQGSSGCGLLNQDKQLVASLTGGTATCSDPSNDLFSMFSKQWDYYKSSDKQLKAWLDPTNTGTTVLQGLDPYDSIVSCALFSNAQLGEKYSLQKTIYPSAGYKSGHNSLKISSYAERFELTDKTLLSSVSIGVAKISSSSMNQNSKIALKVYEEDTTSKLPGNELVSIDLPFNVLSDKKMNHVVLDNPMVVLKHYFIGYEINYSNPTDTFAVYLSPDRLILNKNQAFAKLGNSWKPFYWIPELGISSSLLISANGCQNSMSTIVSPTIDEPLNFQVLYPQSHNANYIVLQNNGNEVFAKISLYDMLGQKLFVEEEMLSNGADIISMEQCHSGVYFLTVETVNARQVLKIIFKRIV